MRGWVFALGAVAWVSSPAGATAEEVPVESPPATLEPPSMETPPVASATSPSDPAVTAERVDLVVIGSPEQLDRVRGVVAAWRLGDRMLNWQRADRFEPRALFEAGVAEPAVRCWVDLSRGAEVRLFFANGRTQRFLARSLETSGQLDEFDREALGQAIELSLLALLEDRAAGLSRKDAETLFVPELDAPQSPRPRAPIRRTLQVETNLRYAVVPLFDRLPLAHGPGLDGVVAFAGEPRFAGFLYAQYRFPDTWRHPLGELRMQSTALRAGAEVAPRLYGWRSTNRESSLRLAVRVGAGIDVLKFEPERGRETPAAVTTSPRARIEPIVSTSVHALLLLQDSLSLRVGPLLDFAPELVRYEVTVDGDRVGVFRSARFRPGAVLAVGGVW